MKSAVRAALALAILALSGLGGCLQSEYETTLYPDGSGKVFLQIAIRQSVIKGLREQAGRPGDLAVEELTALLNQIQKPEKIKEYIDGIVGWKPLKIEETADWLRANYTVYFENINQLQIYSDKAFSGGPRGKQLVFSWRLVQTSNGQTLYLLNGMNGLPAFKVQPGDQAQAKAMAQRIRPLVEDFRVSIKITVPGTITESKGVFETSGRSAGWKIDGPLFLGMLGDLQGPECKRVRTLMDTPESRISWTENAVTPAQMDAWKKELAAAREEWKQMGGAPLSDNELERSFIKAKLGAAQAHLDAGRKEKARKILEDIVQDYPNHKETLTAKALLEKIGK